MRTNVSKELVKTYPCKAFSLFVADQEGECLRVDVRRDVREVGESDDGHCANLELARLFVGRADLDRHVADIGADCRTLISAGVLPSDEIGRASCRERV